MHPEKVKEIRKNILHLVGENLSEIKPGTKSALKVKDLLIKQKLWSQYLEVGIGSDAEIFTGSANFTTLAIALIEKRANRIIDAARACFLKLGKRDLIPLPIIATCNNPIPTTTAKVSK